MSLFYTVCVYIQTASVVSAELEETDSNASALTVGDLEPPKKQFCFKNPTFEVSLQYWCTLQKCCTLEGKGIPN